MVKYVVFKMDLTQSDIDTLVPSGAVNVDIFADSGAVSTDDSEIVLITSDEITIAKLLSSD